MFFDFIYLGQVDGIGQDVHTLLRVFPFPSFSPANATLTDADQRVDKVPIHMNHHACM
jgi:hypothetical protein